MFDGLVQIGKEDYVRASAVNGIFRGSGGAITMVGDFGGSHYYANEWVSSLELLVLALKGKYTSRPSDWGVEPKSKPNPNVDSHSAFDKEY